MPGWSGDYDWQGFIPFDALPQATNPASGFFVSANNKIVPDSYPYFISRDWDLPNRAERIDRAADRDAAVNRPQTSAAIQADTLSIMARRLVPLMTKIVPANDMAREAVAAACSSWDFHMDADKVEPLLFTAWLRAFAHSVLFAKLGDAAADYWDLRPQVMEAILTQRPDWCADPQHPERQTCDARLAEALDTALDRAAPGLWQRDGAMAMGPRPHRLFRERGFGARSGAARLASSDDPDPGRIGHGQSRAERRSATPQHPFEQRFGAGLRIITDLAAPGEVADDGHAGPIGQPAVAALRRSAAPLARLRLAGARTAPAQSTP